ncbi:MAG: hypothetical protein AAAC47_19255, partial [Pararhizobium sp.]
MPTGRLTEIASSPLPGDDPTQKIGPEERSNAFRALVHAVGERLGNQLAWKMTLPHMAVAVIFDMGGLIFDAETHYQEA